MKRILVFILLSLFGSTTFAAKVPGQPLDKIVAIVNEEAITGSELSHSLTIVKAQIAAQNMATPQDKDLQKEVLNQLINKHLQLQMATQSGMKVTEKDLDKAVANIAKQNNVTPTMLYERLNEEGMSTKDYRKEIHDQILMHKIQQQEVVNRVAVSPEEISSFLHSQTWQNNAPSEYHLEDVLVPLSENPSSVELTSAKNQAEDVITKFRHGENLQQITANTANKKASNLQGGDLGWRPLGEIPSAFAERVSRMQPKEVAGPIQTPNGFHIIRLAETRAIDKQQARPSRKQVEEMLLQKKFEEAVATWVSKLRGQAFIVLDPSKEHVLA